MEQITLPPPLLVCLFRVLRDLRGEIISQRISNGGILHNSGKVCCGWVIHSQPWSVTSTISSNPR